MTINAIFESARAAKAINGRLYKQGGAIYRVLGVSGIGPSLTHTDRYTATLDVRPASEQELLRLRIAELQQRLERAAALANGPKDDKLTIDARAEYFALTDEIKALEGKA